LIIYALIRGMRCRFKAVVPR